MQWWVRLGNGQRRVIAGHGGEWWVLLFRLQDFRVLGSRDLGLGFQGSGFWGSGLQGFRSLQPAELRLLAPGCRPPPGQGAQGARPVLNASSFFFFFCGPFSNRWYSSRNSLPGRADVPAGREEEEDNKRSET